MSAYSKAMKRMGVVFILILAFCGLAGFAYLAQREVSGTPNLFGIPLAEYGVLFFGTLFVLAALELARPLFFPAHLIEPIRRGGDNNPPSLVSELPKKSLQMPPTL